MTTTYYDLATWQNAVVQQGDRTISGIEFEVSAHADVRLDEIKASGTAAFAHLAGLVHQAMTSVVEQLRFQVAAMDTRHVAVLVRTPLTVLAGDVPPKIVTEPCGLCAGCRHEDVCDSPSIVLNADGTWMILPGTLGYYAFVTAAVVGSGEPLSCRDAKVISTDEEPWWMRIPAIDEDLIRGVRDRHDLIDRLMPRAS